MSANPQNYENVVNGYTRTLKLFKLTAVTLLTRAATAKILEFSKYV